jgi:hypothetical protein
MQSREESVVGTLNVTSWDGVVAVLGLEMWTVRHYKAM